MGFEYVIDLECPVKAVLPTEALVNLIKQRSQAQSILQRARAEGDHRQPSEIMFTRRLQTPTGVEDRRASVQDLLDRTSQLDQLAPHCQGCSANLDGRKDFGCYGYVAYPIQEATESWLMERLPSALETTAGTILVKSIKDLHFDGRPIAGMRPKPVFFESKTPVVRSWGTWYARTRISSDQILQMLFCVESMLPSHAAMMALILGLIPHDTSPDQLGAILKGGGADGPNLDEPRFPGGDEPGQAGDLIRFLRAMCRASVLGQKLATSF